MWQLDTLLVIIFTVEIAVRMFCFRTMFWRDFWNVLDLIIIVAAVMELIIAAVTNSSSAAFLSNFRLIRVVRILRLIGMFEALSSLAEAFVLATKQACWVAVLVLVVFYMFAILTRELFGDNAALRWTQHTRAVLWASDMCARCRQNPDYMPEWFSTVPRSLITLFQLMTMDDWANIMRPVGNSLPASWIFTLVFVLLGICLMNLVVAIFIDELLKQTAEAKVRREKFELTEKARRLAVCREALLDFDDNKDGYLSAGELTNICESALSALCAF